jgi:hypothetical protein
MGETVQTLNCDSRSCVRPAEFEILAESGTSVHCFECSTLVAREGDRVEPILEPPVELELAPMDAKFVTAHPGDARRAARMAHRERCDYVLREIIPPDRVLVIDPTRMNWLENLRAAA